MHSRLRQALARSWRSLWRREADPSAANKEQGERWAEARARFWAELHAGQREAEAHRARPLS